MQASIEFKILQSKDFNIAGSLGQVKSTPPFRSFETRLKTALRGSYSEEKEEMQEDKGKIVASDTKN